MLKTFYNVFCYITRIQSILLANIAFLTTAVNVDGWSLAVRLIRSFVLLYLHCYLNFL